MINIREKGVLKSYDAIKGYGFITRAVGKDAFVFFNDFINDNDAGALIGSLVEFDILDVPGTKGPRAKNVSIVG